MTLAWSLHYILKTCISQQYCWDKLSFFFLLIFFVKKSWTKNISKIAFLRSIFLILKSNMFLLNYKNGNSLYYISDFVIKSFRKKHQSYRHKIILLSKQVMSFPVNQCERTIKYIIKSWCEMLWKDNVFNQFLVLSDL